MRGHACYHDRNRIRLGLTSSRDGFASTATTLGANGPANMFDVHSHILPGVDDGAADLGVAEEMARAYLDQGVTCVACTPHILPGVYHNTGPDIRAATSALAGRLAELGLPLELVPGADNHIEADFVAGLRSGRLLPLANGPYVLVEPPHHVAPARIAEFFFDLQIAGYVPVLTHPERLTWIEDKYAAMQQLAAQGVWMQITSGALLGAFGRRPRYWAERMLAERLVHVVASDAHNMSARRPDLAAGRLAAERLVGAEEALHLFVTRPRGIVLGTPARELPAISRWSADDDLRDRAEASRAGYSDRARGLAGRLRRLLAH